mmetsp:Transcript_7883/g.14637  ORF Transcript_7883/g.14637 Transcript_7883/m.14637 type:complete len:647 (+) Transcript_7883:106-2046(+)
MMSDPPNFLELDDDGVDPDLVAPEIIDNSRMSLKPKAPEWKIGQEVEVYSRSKDRWIAADIRKIMEENGQCWLQVYYKNSTQMKDVRADSDDIRMKTSASSAHTKNKSSSAMQIANSMVSTSGPWTNKPVGETKNVMDFTQIHHKVALISRQVEGGLYMIKRVASTVHRLAALEQQHVVSSRKILDQENNKLKEKIHDEMGRCVMAWQDTERFLRTQMDKRSALATKMEQKISIPMMQFFTDAELKRKAIMKDEKKYGVEMQRAKVGVSKNLRNCQKLIRSCILAKAEEDEKKKGGGKGKKGKLGGMLKWAKNMMRGNLSDLQNQASTAAKNYSHSIVYANERQQQYFEKELPLICKQFEMLERSRINALHKYLNILNSLSKEHHDPVLKFIESHSETVEGMDPDQDITDFTQNTIRNYGPVPPAEPYTYQLNCTLNDIKAGRFEGNPNSYFYATLDHCMYMQKDKSELDVPIILVNLIDAIKKLGGHTIEGIFRLSAKKDDLRKLREQFDRGEYEVKESSPHVPAGILKQWLRELAEPLIPTERYEEAIKIAKSPEPREPAVKTFIGRLPDINQRVLEHVAKMAGEIAHLSNVNKMTFSNLAIVFAPGMLRNLSEDPAEMLENSKYETLFTKHLLQVASGGGKSA